MCDEDREWFKGVLKDCIEEFDCCFEEVVPCHPVLYGDFMDPRADHKSYKLIDDKEKVSAVTPALKIVSVGDYFFSFHFFKQLIYNHGSFSVGLMNVFLSFQQN